MLDLPRTGPQEDAKELPGFALASIRSPTENEGTSNITPHVGETRRAAVTRTRTAQKRMKDFIFKDEEKKKCGKRKKNSAIPF